MMMMKIADDFAGAGHARDCFLFAGMARPYMCFAEGCEVI
jgi:hypothetical protein